MRLDQLPPEIITNIGSYLENKKNFASTCRSCYLALLPQLWHHISLHDQQQLSKIMYGDYVREVSLSEQPKSLPMSFEMGNPLKCSIESEKQEIDLIRFGKHLVTLCPYIACLEIDLNAYIFVQPYGIIEYRGELCLSNYRSEKTLLQLLPCFGYVPHLTIHTPTVISLCDDDIVLLSERDMVPIMALNKLISLNLEYLDTDVSPETIYRLVQHLPHLRRLQLNWLFPPYQHEHSRLCKLLEDDFGFCPDRVYSKSYFFQVCFTIT
ncbi:hypothetical protein CU097_012057 [Rhizopus azygosporus]|uniref:F-box domain-containing protein n=1 Tax=Rhizopus azygosporus TaxID=86630 RepID=A0A367K4R0_RHIAZ|nr:hypothetical protein CU097_012057 [Rhizopus azygosporus]